MDGSSDLVVQFLAESHEHLDRLDADLVALEQEPDSQDRLSSTVRTVHAISSFSGFLAFDRLQEVTHVGENLLARLRDRELEPTAARTRVLLQMVDTVRSLLTSIEAIGSESSVDVSAVVAAIGAAMADTPDVGGRPCTAPEIRRAVGEPAGGALTRRARRGSGQVVVESPTTARLADSSAVISSSSRRRPSSADAPAGATPRLLSAVLPRGDDRSSAHGASQSARSARCGSLAVFSEPIRGGPVPYTLVNAATLGFDLVRLPAGRSVAEVLLVGLLADADTLARLAGAHPGRGRDREQRGVLAGRARRARELAAAVPTVRSAADAGGRAADLVAQLERRAIGDVPTLERLLREDVLGVEHRGMADLAPEVGLEAADVLADAAVGHCAADVLPPPLRRELTAPYARAVPGSLVAPVPLGADLGPASEDLADLLGGVRNVDDAGRAGWRAAVEEVRAEHRPWAAAMHEACWAAHVSGRTRSLATARLHAVQAFLDGGFDASDGASGVWNAVAGSVQATAMADLLDADSLAVLVAPWRRSSGAA